MPKGNSPVFKTKLYGAFQAQVFRNKNSKGGTYPTIKLSKKYVDRRSGAWKEKAINCDRQDLQNLKACLEELNQKWLKNK